MDRRKFLAGMAATGVASVGTPAFAESPIASIINSSKRDSWADQFDARKGDAKLSSTNIPVFSPQTPIFVQRAIDEHRQIAAQGGWPVVPANQKLQLGVQSKNVRLLRQRLIVSRDLDAIAGDLLVSQTSARRIENHPIFRSPCDVWR